MGHHHAHSHHGSRRRLKLALLITAAFTVVEVIGGVVTHSLALLADAGHMLTDSMALALAVLAFTIGARPPDEKRSFGYQRLQILAAFVNGVTLIAIVVWILIEAMRRFLSPPEVLGGTMLGVAAVGLVVNIVSFTILHGGDRDNLNMRGAALHVLGDLLGSVAAILAAVVIIYTGWMPIDPILSVIVAVLILRSAIFVVRRSAHILLEGAPDWVSVEEIRARLTRDVSGVADIHHVHVWGLTQEHLILTMHLVIEPDVERPSAVVRTVKQILEDEYGFAHSTIETELDDCTDAG
ncbi:MAG: cation diffusion facilitator family transporter [Pseudomonadota bacterium]